MINRLPSFLDDLHPALGQQILDLLKASHRIVDEGCHHQQCNVVIHDIWRGDFLKVECDCAWGELKIILGQLGAGETKEPVALKPGDSVKCNLCQQPLANCHLHAGRR